MQPKNILELRADIAAKLNNPDFRYGMASIVEMGWGKKDFAEASRICDFAPRTASIAENFFVVADMCDLVSYASTVLDSTDRTDVTLAPSRAGFAYFEKPLTLIDVRGGTINVNAMLWDTAAGGNIVVHMWNDEYTHPDDSVKYVNEVAFSLSGSEKERYEWWERTKGRWGYVGLQVYADGECVGEESKYVSEELAQQMELPGPGAFMNPIRTIHSFFLMISQTLVARELDRGDKKTARRMRQMKVPNEVTIITFRRTKYEKKLEGEAKIEWNHRWLVRGYWRWQPYKNEEGEWARKRIWINPHVKGPEDKPLIVTTKINAFVK